MDHLIDLRARLCEQLLSTALLIQALGGKVGVKPNDFNQTYCQRSMKLCPLW